MTATLALGCLEETLSGLVLAFLELQEFGTAQHQPVKVSVCGADQTILQVITHTRYTVKSP